MYVFYNLLLAYLELSNNVLCYSCIEHIPIGGITVVIRWFNCCEVKTTFSLSVLKIHKTY